MTESEKNYMLIFLTIVLGVFGILFRISLHYSGFPHNNSDYRRAHMQQSHSTGESMIYPSVDTSED